VVARNEEDGLSAWSFKEQTLPQGFAIRKDPAPAFATWVEDRGDRGEMRNDDTTLLGITF